MASQHKAGSYRPALTPESRESQMISLAVDCAEKQLREGTASSQLIVHYLKLGTERERLERKKLEKEVELVQAKADSIKASKRNDEMYAEALKAMRAYSGHPEECEESYDY